MSKHYTADDFSEDSLEDKEEEDANVCNRIYLNFSREFRHPSKDRYNYLKVKELFKYLSERRDLQEMKVSGWLDKEESEKRTDKGDEEEENEREEEEGSKGEGSESYYDEGTTPKRGGQRFAMSRDFWYRKLNTLKAQKLDEVALEARDIPPDHQLTTERRLDALIKIKQISDKDITMEKPEDVIAEIDRFEKAVAKPVEKDLKTRFVNVYENRKYFRIGDRCD